MSARDDIAAHARSVIAASRAKREDAAAMFDALEAMNAICETQGLSWYHPYTCGNDSDKRLYPEWISGRTIVLRCPDCDYEQTIDAAELLNRKPTEHP
jgi:hypothetical protein